MGEKSTLMGDSGPHILLARPRSTCWISSSTLIAWLMACRTRMSCIGPGLRVTSAR